MLKVVNSRRGFLGGLIAGAGALILSRKTSESPSECACPGPEKHFRFNQHGMPICETCSLPVNLWSK